MVSTQPTKKRYQPMLTEETFQHLKNLTHCLQLKSYANTLGLITALEIISGNHVLHHSKRRIVKNLYIQIRQIR